MHWPTLLVTGILVSSWWMKLPPSYVEVETHNLRRLVSRLYQLAMDHIFLLLTLSDMLLTKEYQSNYIVIVYMFIWPID
jgi:hypothetical protein